MGRKKKQGLDSFPLEARFFSDRRTRMLVAAHGPAGALAYLYILSSAYKNGGWVRCDSDFVDSMVIALDMFPDETESVIADLIRRGLLSRPLFERQGILSSRGVQRRFQRNMKPLHREVSVPRRLWLLPPEETEAHIKLKD